MADMTLTKTPITEQPPEERVCNFKEVTLGYTAEEAIKEGKPAKGKIEISDETVAAARERVNKLLGAHVLYPELDLDFLKKEFVK